MGLGTENVVAVETDVGGRMLPKSLKEAVKVAKTEGKEPFFVNAVAGTTVLGTFDPIDELADLCKEEGLWLHVDVRIKSRKQKHATLHLPYAITYANFYGFWNKVQT